MAPRSGERRASARRGGRRGAGRSGESTDGRIRLLRVLAVAAFLLVGGRAIALASSSSDLTSIAAGQQRSTHTLPAHRGTIFDRDGHELAVGELRQTVYATPYLIEDAYAAAGDLCRVLRIHSAAEQQRIVEVLSDRDSGFAFVARKVPPAFAERAVGLGIPGVGSYPEEKRVYPMRGVGAQVIGFAGLDNTGLAGVESMCEEALHGADGVETVLRDPVGTDAQGPAGRARPSPAPASA